MVVPINNVIEACVRGNSSLYSIHSFVDTWSALLRWTEDVFGTKQGGVHIPSFCKVTWSDPERSEFSTDLRAPQARSRERQPLFVVSQRFLKRFGLKSRNPLETCEVRAEEISFVKLAIKYSTTLSKDSAYSATKRLIHRIGAAMSSGADCEIDFGVGRLHCHERQVWFVFHEDYQRDDDPFDRRSSLSADGAGARRAAADPASSKPFISVPRNMAAGTLTATQNAFQSLARPGTSMSAGTTLSALMAKAGIASSDAQRVLASAAAASGGAAAAAVHKPNDIPSIPIHRPSTASAKSHLSCGGSTLPGCSPGGPSAAPAAKQPKLVQSAVALALMAQQQRMQKPPSGAAAKPPLPNHMKSTAPSFPLIPASGQPMPVRTTARSMNNRPQHEQPPAA